MTDLLEIMVRLRDPETGCPWDKEQDFASIAPYTIEEAYEVADAITRGDMGDLRDELGDLLLQVVYHARMAQEAGHFGFDDVVDAICDKMVRRHPHVFGGQKVDDVRQSWDAIKAQEKPASGDIFETVPRGMAAMMRAQKVHQKVQKTGFDWPDEKAAFLKVEEEFFELKNEMNSDEQNIENIEEEIGDVFLSLIHLTNKLNLNSEILLRAAQNKFENRFKNIEKHLEKEGKSLDQISLEEMLAAWRMVKRCSDPSTGSG